MRFFGAPALEEVADDGTSVVDVHLLYSPVAAPRENDTAPTSEPLLAVPLAWPALDLLRIPPSFGRGTTHVCVEFVHRDLVYGYTAATDAQRGCRRLLRKEAFGNHTYSLAYEEETVPPHAFPSTDEITRRTEVTRTTYKLRHRLWFIHDAVSPAGAGAGEVRHTFFFRYFHAPNVDVAQVTSDLRRALRSLHTQQAPPPTASARAG